MWGIVGNIDDVTISCCYCISGIIIDFDPYLIRWASRKKGESSETSE